MFSAENSVLIVIDVQGNLAQSVHNKERLFKNIRALIKAAQILQIPILLTEQAPDKIGKTIPEIKELLEDVEAICKECFSCGALPEFMDKLKALQRKEIIIAGIESHVCVLQTVNDLIESGYTVQVVLDAISSREQINSDVAIERMKALGATPSTMEMMVTELIKGPKHAHFKEILSLMK